MPNASTSLGRHPIYDTGTRLTTTVTVRLGVKNRSDRTGKEYPREVDYFVLNEEDGLTDEIRDAYSEQGGKLAPKELTCMVPFEPPVPGHPDPRDDYTVSIYNTAWGWKSGLLCKGTGADLANPGRAESSDETFAKRIAAANPKGDQAWQAENGRWQIQCLGKDCVKYRLMTEQEVPTPDGNGTRIAVNLDPSKDPEAPCKLTVLFKALLLRPPAPGQEVDPGDVLGVIQIASGSINTIRDVLSGFALMREVTGGRAAMIPFTLTRKATTTTKGARSKHYTLAIKVESRRWQKFSRIPERSMFLPPKELDALKELAEHEVALDTVRDIIPRPLELEAARGTEGDVAESLHPRVPQGGTVVENNFPEDQPVTAPSGESDDRRLAQAEIAELKDLLGGRTDPDNIFSAGVPGVSEKLRALIKQAAEEFGEQPPRLADLSVRYRDWIKARVEQPVQPGSEQAEESTDPDDAPPPEEPQL